MSCYEYGSFHAGAWLLGPSPLHIPQPAGASLLPSSTLGPVWGNAGDTEAGSQYDGAEGEGERYGWVVTPLSGLGQVLRESGLWSVSDLPLSTPAYLWGQARLSETSPNGLMEDVPPQKLSTLAFIVSKHFSPPFLARASSLTL